MPAHLRPMAALAPDVIICGDPARALMLAETFLTQPRMSNHHRGLWGYVGQTEGGLDLSMQATGIGGPSAAVVLGELAGLGVQRVIRVGGVRAIGEDLPLGARLAVGAARCSDGASRALGAESGGLLYPHPTLAAGLAERLGASAEIESTDVHADQVGPRNAPAPPGLAGALAQATDLQTAAVFAAASRYGIAAAAAVLVVRSGSVPLEDDPVEVGMKGLGRAAVETLAA